MQDNHESMDHDGNGRRNEPPLEDIASNDSAKNASPIATADG